MVSQRLCPGGVGQLSGGEHLPPGHGSLDWVLGDVVVWGTAPCSIGYMGNILVERVDLFSLFEGKYQMVA